MARKAGRTVEKVRKRAGRPRRQRPADQGQFSNTDVEKLDRKPQTVQIRLQAEAISHLAEGVIITEGSDWSESTIVFVNRAMRRITGYGADELIRCPRHILFGKGTNRD